MAKLVGPADVLELFLNLGRVDQEVVRRHITEWGASPPVYDRELRAYIWSLNQSLD